MTCQGTADPFLMSIGSNNLSKQAKRVKRWKASRKEEAVPRDSLLLLRLHCSPVSPYSPKTFKLIGIRQFEQKMYFLWLSAVSVLIKMGRGTLNATQCFLLAPVLIAAPLSCLRSATWTRNPGESDEGDASDGFYFLFAAAMRLHSMLKTQTTFTMGAPQQGGATWAAAAVPIVRSAGWTEKMKKRGTAKILFHNF